MEGTYKLFAAAVIGLALVFGSTEIGNRIGAPPVTSTPATSPELAKTPANAPQPVIIPAPNSPPPPLPDPIPDQAARRELPADESPPAATDPALGAESDAPAPMIILPAESG